MLNDTYLPLDLKRVKSHMARFNSQEESKNKGYNHVISIKNLGPSVSRYHIYHIPINYVDRIEKREDIISIFNFSTVSSIDTKA